MNKLIFIIVVVAVAFDAAHGDLCSVCQCVKNEDNLNIFCHSNAKSQQQQHQIELDNIAWPSAKRIIAHFNELGLTFLPKLTGDANVIGLNFDNNDISVFTQEPLQFFKNLEHLSLANNKITKLPKDFARTPIKLRELNLSMNALEEIDGGVFDQFKELHTLDLSFNRFRKISSELLSSLNRVEKLNLQGNLIFDIEDLDDGNTDDDSDEGTEIVTKKNLNITQLNLAGNNFAVITAKTFKDFDKLEMLDISKNKIANVNQKAFKNMKQLKHLDLSENIIDDLHLHLPESVEVFRVNGNRIRQWPLTQLPDAIEEIHVENNRLTDLFSPSDTISNLHSLNASDNLIEFLPDHVALPALTELDLSFNQLTSVPQAMAVRTPALITLSLDHNPIETILFVEPIAVSNLSISNMPNLRAIDAKAFSTVTGRIPVRNHTCTSISVARCPLLEFIHEQSFQGVNLCKLDLSGNKLKEIPENLTNWAELVDGIDLQDNPLDCSCNAQWMLDTILNLLYLKPEHQHFLSELRCASPEAFAGQRIVRYYKRRMAFCNPSSRMMLEPMMNDEPVEAGLHLHLNRGPGVGIIIGASIFVLLALIAGGLYMVREEKKRLRRNREKRLFSDLG